MSVLWSHLAWVIPLVIIAGAAVAVEIRRARRPSTLVRRLRLTSSQVDRVVREHGEAS